MIAILCKSWWFLDQQEALSTLKVALEFKTLGKDDKALRLFKHALALAPKNPEVLTHYGEYLEHNRRDILSADLMYFQVSSTVEREMTGVNCSHYLYSQL